MLTAMRSRLYGPSDNNNNNNTTTTTGNTTNNSSNNNNNNNNRSTTETHHTQSLVAVGEEGEEGEEDEDVASSSFFMTEVTPTKKKATAAASLAATASNHFNPTHSHIEGQDTLAMAEVSGTDAGAGAGGGGMTSEEGMGDPHSLPPFARHALGQRQHASTSHTLLHRHPHHPQRSTQSSLSHRENVFSQLDAVPLRYRHDILHEGSVPPGSSVGNTYPRTSPVSMQRPLHGTFPMPGGGPFGSGVGGGGGERGGAVDSQKRELDRLRENHTAAFR